ncbi:MAG: hypothetical protein Q8J89_00795 [Caulobacter sp.]|nr:hypothetical protein [Caulobacter sp.]
MIQTLRAGVLRHGPFIVLAVCLWAVFQLNVGGIAPGKFFETFQANGQARVMGGILADDLGMDKRGANLGKVYLEPFDEDGSIGQTYTAFNHPDRVTAGDLRFADYPTQYGLQQPVYGFLHANTALDSLAALQLIPSLLTAVVLVALFRRYLVIFGPRFATLFLLGMALSPWFIAFARNLYWNPFVLLLPALAAAFLYSAEGVWKRRLLLVAVGAAVTLKCLINYEYLTCVAVLAAAVFMVGPYFDPRRTDPRPDFLMAATVMAVCVAGFVVAFLIHAGARGDTLLEGIRSMYEQDIARRTYGDASRFTGEAAESLRATPLDVFRIYLFDWPERRRMIIPGKLFLVMLAVALAGLAWMFVARHPARARNFWLLSVYAFVPFSWYLFAKGHSYTQTHINFVLLYIGFLPALIYVVMDVAVMAVKQARALWPKARVA